MRIGIFGGTFDPIHNGHVALAEQFLKCGGLDEVWFLVTPMNPWKKNKHLSPDAFRLSLVQKAVENHPGLVASDYEFHLMKPSFTFQTLRHLRDDYPDNEFVLLIGADNWVAFDKWAEYEEIICNHEIVVYPREGYEVDTDDMPETVHFMHTELYNVSSTQIRRMLRAGEPVDHLVPPAIIEMLHHYTDNE